MLHSVSLHWGRSQYRICPILFHFFSLYNLNSYFDVPTSVATAAAILHVSVQRPSQPSRLSPRELWDTVSVGWAGSFGLPCKNCIASQNRGMQPVLTLFETHCNLGFFSS